LKKANYTSFKRYYKLRNILDSNEVNPLFDYLINVKNEMSLERSLSNKYEDEIIIISVKFENYSIVRLEYDIDFGIFFPMNISSTFSVGLNHLSNSKVDAEFLEKFFFDFIGKNVLLGREKDDHE
jgi:hypothetical protein